MFLALILAVNKTNGVVCVKFFFGVIPRDSFASFELLFSLSNYSNAPLFVILRSRFQPTFLPILYLLLNPPLLIGK